MRINIKSQLFEKGKLEPILEKYIDNQLLKENNWFLKNEYAFGFVKDIRIEGLCFLSYKLSMYKNNEILVNYDNPLFKLHFEFEGDVTYQSNNKNNIKIKKDTFDLLYATQNNKQIIGDKHTKNSIELLFDESYIKSLVGHSFTQLFYNLKKAYTKGTTINNGVFITDDTLKIINDINNCEYTGCKRQTLLELKIKELIIIALTIYENRYNDDDDLMLNAKSLHHVENYIKLNLKKELKIAKLSVLAGMNTSMFKKCFKQCYGTTVFKYITALRIEKAKTLIQQKSYTISQASYEVGYKNAQHFTVAFKKNTGYLPRELKKN